MTISLREIYDFSGSTTSIKPPTPNYTKIPLLDSARLLLGFANSGSLELSLWTSGDLWQIQRQNTSHRSTFGICKFWKSRAVSMNIWTSLIDSTAKYFSTTSGFGTSFPFFSAAGSYSSFLIGPSLPATMYSLPTLEARIFEIPQDSPYLF